MNKVNKKLKYKVLCLQRALKQVGSFDQHPPPQQCGTGSYDYGCSCQTTASPALTSVLECQQRRFHRHEDASAPDNYIKLSMRGWASTLRTEGLQMFSPLGHKL